jgi:hypothetical protein
MATNGNGTNHLGVNLAFTKFIFVTPARDDDAARTRLRTAGGLVARGFFNDFEAEGRETAQEAIQFLVNENGHQQAGLAGARYALQVSSKYRPRLLEFETELRRRLGDNGTVSAIDGAVRVPQYTSAEMYAYAYKNASARLSGRAQRNVIIIPIRKTPEWWEKSPLDRHSYFYPHGDGNGGSVKGHARSAEAGISTIYRRLYYNPDGHSREGEFDFITYFECADEHLMTFDQICRSLRDERQNPEWRYVEEGPEWRGRRVLKW